MKYRSMPTGEEKLSALGFGCMRLPTKVGGVASNLINKEEAIKQIRYAIDNGVNYIDTAYPYHAGASESFLGEYILKDGYREKVYIATKMPCFMVKRKEQLREIFEKQLKKLQVDYIDYYLLHTLDGQTWNQMLDLGIIDFMNEIRKENKVRHMGFSFHGKKDDFKRIVDEYNWEFVQVQYNILDEHFQAGIEGIEYASQKGLGVIVMEPLRGGSLVGKIPKDVQKIYDGASIKRKPSDWALRWIYNNPAVTVVLSGMNNMDHIKENIQTASTAYYNGLSDKEIEIIENVRNAYKDLMKVRCTGCAYCMPCPAKIDIPNAFKQLNNYYMFSKPGATIQYALFSGIRTDNREQNWTSNCINCGKCEKVCPQNIPVRQIFKQVQKDLEKPYVKSISKIASKFMK